MASYNSVMNAKWFYFISLIKSPSIAGLSTAHFSHTESLATDPVLGKQTQEVLYKTLGPLLCASTQAE